VHPIGQGAGTARAAELQLVDRCRQGELGAFEELYRQHAGRLFSLAVRMLGNPADAEDMLQEIFLSAHRKLESFRGEAALGTWLYRLAMNQILDHVRSRAARTGQLTDGLDDATVLADGMGHRLADRAIDRIDLERALAELPKDAVPRSCCTTWRGWNTAKCPTCSASRKGRRSRKYIKPACGCEDCLDGRKLPPSGGRA
jgi:RNA polymerase sigma factor (sigma-70 family)